jgi:dihydrofolate reductase
MFHILILKGRFQFKEKSMISIIVAISDDYGIGRDNDLLWKIPEDLKRFRRLTTGNCIIMGKRTWESLPKRPLPDRRNIVLTDVTSECIDCSITAYSIQDALDKSSGCAEVFIMGGGSVYRQFMPLADRLYITRIHRSKPADTWFPEITEKEWRVAQSEEHPGDSEGIPPYSYIIYERKRD